MTLDELKLQVKKDLEVDDETLDKESYKNQELYAKYLDHKTNFELLLYKAKGDYKILFKDKWEYYGGKADAKIYVTKPFDLKVLKTDLNIYIESDEDIIKLEHKIAYLETTIKYIDGVLRSIQSRGWDIKNAISWKQFEVWYDMNNIKWITLQANWIGYYKMWCLMNYVIKLWTTLIMSNSYRNPHTQRPQVNLTGVMNVSRWTMGGFVTENNTTMR